MPTSAAVLDASRAASLPTEQRLLLAAERLFAERGVDGVSLRSVMVAAETNVASVHYHFGSREGLLDGVVRSRLDTISFGRDSLVAELGEDPGPRRLAAAFIEPVLDLVRNGGADWVRVIGHLLRANHPALAPVSDGFLERNARFVELLRAADPTVSDATLGFRLAQAMSLALTTLGDLGTLRGVLSRDGLTWTEDEIADELVDVIASILVGPPTRS